MESTEKIEHEMSKIREKYEVCELKYNKDS